jgi:hypothetical protein
MGEMGTPIYPANGSGLRGRGEKELPIISSDELTWGAKGEIGVPIYPINGWVGVAARGKGGSDYSD